MSKEKVEKLTGDRAAERIFEYMKDTNRPYSTMNVFDNLRGQVAKKQVEILMEELVTQQRLIKKTYGKFTIYLVNQNVFGTTSPEEISQLTQEVASLTEQKNGMQEKHRQLQYDIGQLSQRAQNVQNLQVVKRKHAEVSAMYQNQSAALAAFNNQGPLAVTGKQLDGKIAQMYKEVQKRRRTFFSFYGWNALFVRFESKFDLF